MKLDSYHYHEAIDRTYSIQIMIQELLLDHPVTEQHEETKQLLDAIQVMVQELYYKYSELADKQKETVFENPDPHKAIREEYEDVKDKRFVKVERYSEDGWRELKRTITFHSHLKYRLRYFEMDWNKFLAWQYFNNEWIEVEVSDNDFKSYQKDYLIGHKDAFYTNSNSWEYCRIPKGTPIRDEWLKPKGKDR